MALRIALPSRKPSWPDVRGRVAVALERARPGLAVRFGEEGPHWVAWHEGPSITTVAALVGELTGWQWAAVAPTAEPAEPPVGPAGQAQTLWVRRSLSERAIASSLVRFYGARGRYFRTTDAARYREAFAAICDVDDPSRSGYPIVDAVVDLLLGAGATHSAGHGGGAPGDPIDELSARLERLGYDNLWARAYAQVR